MGEGKSSSGPEPAAAKTAPTPLTNATAQPAAAPDQQSSGEKSKKIIPSLLKPGQEIALKDFIVCIQSRTYSLQHEFRKLTVLPANLQLLNMARQTAPLTGICDLVGNRGHNAVDEHRLRYDHPVHA